MPPCCLQSKPTEDMQGAGPDSGVYENKPPFFPLETLFKNFLGERQEIVARTLRVRSLRHTECADYYRVRYFRPLALALSKVRGLTSNPAI